MKKLMYATVALVAILNATQSFGQIDRTLSKVTWRVGKEKVIYGNTILRVEGRNNIRGMTNVGYQTHKHFMQEIVDQAESEMWSPEKKEKTFKLYENYAQGGLIHLYITRLTIDAANTDMFTIVVQDSSGKEVMRKELPSDVPQVPASGTDYWWNYTSIAIPYGIEGKHFIYVIDQLGRENNKIFRFKIEL